MKLVKEHELIWSPVVANNRMNRKRKASGVNSYEQELRFKPEAFLDARITGSGQAKWLDLCCGEGNALLQYAESLAKRDLQEKAILKGIDLVDQFQEIPPSIHCLEFQIRPLVGWSTDMTFDLITCIHGLHYIGDKIAVLTAALRALAPKGVFIANFDVDSIKIEGNEKGTYIKRALLTHKIDYQHKRKMITCTGPRNLKTGLVFLGADDQRGPNYTGQETVDGYYRLHADYQQQATKSQRQ